MTGRLLMTVVLATAAATFACGDDDGANPEEQQIMSISQNAVYAWIDDGAEGLSDYLADSATALCPADVLQQSLDDFGTPSDWRETRDITFQGDLDATATVVIDMPGGDKEEEWHFVKTNESWRIAEIGGVIPCRVPAA